MWASVRLYVTAVLPLGKNTAHWNFFTYGFLNKECDSFKMSLGTIQNHWVITARNLHFVVTLFVKEDTSKEIPVSSVISQGVKRPWRKAERSPPFTTTVKNEWSYTSIPPHSSMTSTTDSPDLRI